MKGVTAGILRGTGRQKLGAMLNFFCYYVIGLPLGIPLAFRAGLGTLGIWTGLAVADGLQVQTPTHSVYILMLTVSVYLSGCLLHSTDSVH